MGLFDFNEANIAELLANRDIPGLVKCLGSGDAPTQFNAAEALIQLGSWKGFAFLVSSLHHKNALMRATAAEILGDLRDPRAISSLILAMKDMDPDVSDTARQALYKINTSEALEAISRMETPMLAPATPKDDAKPSISDALFGGAAEIKDLRADAVQCDLDQMAEIHFTLATKYYLEDRFTQALDKVNLALELKPQWSEASDLKGEILEELGEQYLALIAYQKAVFLDKNNQDAREHLTKVIDLLEIPSTTVDELLEALGSDEWDMRRDAVGALLGKQTPEALQGIIRALKDEDTEVTAAALEALECCDLPGAAEAIRMYYDQFNVDEEGVPFGQDDADQFRQPNDQAFLDSGLQGRKVEIPAHLTTQEYVDKASTLIDDGEYAHAYVQCQLALFSQPHNADAWNMLGIIHEENAELRAAFYYYKEAVDCDPAYAEARSNLEDIIGEIGDPNSSVPIVISDLESGENDLIYDAVVTIGHLNGQEAAENLIEMIGQVDRKTTLAIVESLAMLGITHSAETIFPLIDALWIPPASMETMSLERMDKARSQSLSDWADRCKIIFALAKLGNSQLFVRALIREFARIQQLDRSFQRIGNEDFRHAYSATLDLAVYMMENLIPPNDLTAIRNNIPMSKAPDGGNETVSPEYAELTAILEKIASGRSK